MSEVLNRLLKKLRDSVADLKQRLIAASMRQSSSIVDGCSPVLELINTLNICFDNVNSRAALNAGRSSHKKGVRLSNTWIVAKLSKNLPRFSYHTKDFLACEKKNGWWGRPLLPEIFGQTVRVGAK